MEKYSYSADDKSLLTPAVYKFFVNPFLSVLPRSVPANFITLVSNTFVLCSFLIAYANYVYGTSLFLWVIPLLCLAYIVGDCSDGVQARRTGTASPLGEYFDHFLDSFVTGLLTGTIMLVYRINYPVLLFCVYQFLYIGQIGTFWKRLKKGIMHFSALSSTEGIMAIAVMSALYSFPWVRKIDTYKLLLGFSFPRLIMISAYTGAVFTGIISVFHTKKCSLRLIMHILFSASIGAVLVWHVKAAILFQTLIISFYNIVFIESLLSATASRTEGKKEGVPDLLVPLSCVLFFLLPQYMLIVQIVQTVYLFIRVVFQFFIFFNKYKHFWYWKNP